MISEGSSRESFSDRDQAWVSNPGPLLYNSDRGFVLQAETYPSERSASAKCSSLVNLPSILLKAYAFPSAFQAL